MPEEMNLYKRCKNIFKAHGVDMGGGSSDSPVEFVDVEWDGVNNPTASKTVSELVALGESGKILYARMYAVEGDSKALHATAIATMFGQGHIEFGHNEYSPNRDGNYPFIRGDSDDDGDEWEISL